VNTKLCFINKVWQKHIQIINTGGEHSAIMIKMCIYRLSSLTSFLWQFSSIPPPPLLNSSSPKHSQKLRLFLQNQTFTSKQFNLCSN